MTVREQISSVYDNLTPVQSAIFNNGQLYINDAEATELAKRTILQTGRIPAGLFDASSPDLKNRMLREHVVAIDLDDRPRVAVLEGKAQGVMPAWKATSRISEQLVSAGDFPADSFSFRGTVFERPEVFGFQELVEFRLSDSVYFAGKHMNIELFGIKVPQIGIRVVRQICTNGMVALVSDLGADFDPATWATIGPAIAQTVHEQAETLPNLLERMKENKVGALELICKGELSTQLPKRVRDDAPKYVDNLIKNDDTELERRLIDTSFGVLNIVTATARSLAPRSRDKVEQTGMGYMLAQAA